MDRSLVQNQLNLVAVTGIDDDLPILQLSADEIAAFFGDGYRCIVDAYTTPVRLRGAAGQGDGSSGLAIKAVVQFIVGVSIGGILGGRNGIIHFFLFAAEGVVRQRGGGASIQCHTSAQSDAQQA